MKEVKCSWCKAQGMKSEMHVEEKPTGKYNKNGSEKILRKYMHKECVEDMLRDKGFKKKELEEFDGLYQHLLSLYGVNVLDSRMIERLHDLRNGNVRVGNKKVKRYKEGVEFSIILKAYQYLDEQIRNVQHYKNFENKWNEFAYTLSIVINKLNDIEALLRHKERQEAQQQVVIEKNIDSQITDFSAPVKHKKKADELDISSFL